MLQHSRFTTEPLLSTEWIGGATAAPKIQALAFTLKQRVLEKFNADNRLNLTSYVPWMTDERHGWLAIPVFSRRGKTEVWKEARELRMLASAFSANDGALRLIADPMVRVEIDTRADEDRPWFEPRYLLAKQQLEKALPWIGSIYSSVVHSVIPVRLRGLPSGGRFSFSSHLTKGALYFEFPERSESSSEWEDALAISRELGHQVTMLYLNADPIILSPPEREGYRKLHEAVGLGYALEAARALEIAREGNVLGEELKRELVDLRAQYPFSEVGELILRDLETILDFS
jgi:hypothetical protein